MMAELWDWMHQLIKWVNAMVVLVDNQCCHVLLNSGLILYWVFFVLFIWGYPDMVWIPVMRMAHFIYSHVWGLLIPLWWRFTRSLYSTRESDHMLNCLITEVSLRYQPWYLGALWVLPMGTVSYYLVSILPSIECACRSYQSCSSH